MGPQSRHVSISINRPASEVYTYAADPSHLPDWAAGLTGHPLERAGDQWVTNSPMGRIEIRFAAPNAYGVLDHDVTMPSGEVVYNPLRVIRDGDGCEVVFTVRRQPGMSDEQFDADAAAVLTDLTTLKQLLEG